MKKINDRSALISALDSLASTAPMVAAMTPEKRLSFKGPAAAVLRFAEGTALLSDADLTALRHCVGRVAPASGCPVPAAFTDLGTMASAIVANLRKIAEKDAARIMQLRERLALEASMLPPKAAAQIETARARLKTTLARRPEQGEGVRLRAPDAKISGSSASDTPVDRRR